VNDMSTNVAEQAGEWTGSESFDLAVEELRDVVRDISYVCSNCGSGSCAGPWFNPSYSSYSYGCGCSCECSCSCGCSCACSCEH
jgi:hypothetical protein